MKLIDFENMKPINFDHLIGNIINLPGALDFKNNPIDIEVETIVHCYNMAYVIINNLYIVTYKELEKYTDN